MTTVAPSPAKMRATAAPIPPLPPTMTATFPVRFCELLIVAFCFSAGAISCRLSGKPALYSLPCFKVVFLKLGRFRGVRRQPHDEAALEHESHRVVYLVRLKRRCGC